MRFKNQETQNRRPQINNSFYEELKSGWYTFDQHPIALLRAEAECKNKWVESIIIDRSLTQLSPNAKVLDVACGAGFLANHLAQRGFKVTGIDASNSSLIEARRHDVTKSVNYICGRAEELPFEDSSFDVVCVMDFLEHTETPQRVLQECSRVLARGGILLWHTFNRNWLSWLIALKLVEFVVPNTPKHLHVYELFIKPKELQFMLDSLGFEDINFCGLAPKPDMAMLKSVLSRRVHPQFGFCVVPSLALGYMGYAIKTATIL